MLDAASATRLSGLYAFPAPSIIHEAEGPSIDLLWPKEGVSDRQEQSDRYYRIVAILNDRWRVIICKDAIQWILQKRRRDGRKWDGESYCRTRDGLLRATWEKVRGQTDPDAMAVLLDLPSSIERRGKVA